MKSELVKALQSRLKHLGWYSGPVDGDPGPLTETAVIDFKRAHDLRPRAFVGPITLTRLFSPAARSRPAGSGSQRPWYDEAERLMWTREAPGSANNPVIMDWADDLDLHYTGDDVPWCGLFVAHCLRIGAPHDAQPDNVLGARNWQSFGRKSEPQMGAILVFWRGSRTGWKGHVGFYAGEDNAAFHVLGGNQSNAVTITRISKDRLLACRMPKSFAGRDGLRAVGAATGALSTNEA